MLNYNHKEKNMKNIATCLLLALSICFTNSCEKIDLENSEIDLSEFSEPEAKGLTNMIKKAEYIAGFKWTPMKDINIAFVNYPANESVYGIPYSSVKEIDTYVGTGVSFYTFQTAVNNPRSVMYTENITKLPYFGNNCSTYFGTTCSASVEYALGIDITYGTASFSKLSYFKLKENSAPKTTQIGDILLTDGHVVLVLNVVKNGEGRIKTVYILESGHYGTVIKNYTLAGLETRWDRDDFKAYRYTKIDENNLGMDNCCYYETQKLICPNRGDRSNYLTSDKITLNLLSEKISNVSVFKDGTAIGSYSVTDGMDDLFLTDLQSGLYSVVATDVSGANIDDCSFNVVESNVKVEKLGEDKAKVTFSAKNAVPYYVRVCDITGAGKGLYVLKDDDLKSGSKIVSIPSESRYFVKVLYNNSFGQVRSQLIPLN